MSNKATKEYADILKKYMKKFSLDIVDIVFLAKSTNKKNIQALLDYKGGLTLETQEAISAIFGLRYFEFGNPNQPIPKLDSLPEKTKLRIAFRKQEGTPREITYTHSKINQQIADVITNFNVGDEFLAEDIASSILKEYEITYSASQIIDRINKSFKEVIIKTDRKETNRKGRGPKPIYYKLIKKKS